MTDREFDTLISKLDNLDRDNKLLADRIELYRQTSEVQIHAIRAEVEVFQQANKQQIEATNKQIEAFQQANKQQIEAFQQANKQQIEATNKQIEAFQQTNKQQFNVSLGVLVTAAITVIVSAVLGMR